MRLRIAIDWLFTRIVLTFVMDHGLEMPADFGPIVCEADPGGCPECQTSDNALDGA